MEQRTMCLEGEVLYLQSRAVPIGITLPDAWPGKAIQAALLSLAMLGYSRLRPPTPEKAAQGKKPFWLQPAVRLCVLPGNIHFSLLASH